MKELQRDSKNKNKNAPKIKKCKERKKIID
jgi:hypothetical protein